jgi:hypothetical protein
MVRSDAEESPNRAEYSISEVLAAPPTGWFALLSCHTPKMFPKLPPAEAKVNPLWLTVFPSCRNPVPGWDSDEKLMTVVWL